MPRDIPSQSPRPPNKELPTTAGSYFFWARKLKNCDDILVNPVIHSLVVRAAHVGKRPQRIYRFCKSI